MGIDQRIGRRRALGLAGLAALAAGCAAVEPAPAAPTPAAGDPQARLAAIEARFGGRLGVRAIDTGSGATLSWRADERFLLCSTGKAISVAAVLRRTADQPAQLDRLVRYTAEQIVPANSPTTRQRVGTGMTVGELCEAAIVVSDNTAQNLLLDELGGPRAVTAFVRALGDPVTRFDRYEPELNDSAPGDERDTTSPTRIAEVLRVLALGDALPAPARARLVALMEANTTGDAQIRAGVPAGWRVGDKTGSGSQGESNDIGIVWPPDRAPLVIAVYTAPNDPGNEGGKAVIAEATRAAVEALVPAR